MSHARILLSLAYADVLERTRRYSFLAMMAATFYLVYALAHGDLVLMLNSWTGVMNAAWVGGMVASSAIILITLFGFYLVKNTIERDTRTGVGQIIAATPVTGVAYLLGKWISNWIVLTVLVAILAVSSIAILLLASGWGSLQFVPLLLPFILLAVPAMATVAALAVIFEVVPWLRGGAGNAFYFLAWSGLFIVPFFLESVWLDWSGIITIARSMGAAVQAVDPSYTMGFSLTAGGVVSGHIDRFVWQGIVVTPVVLTVRLVWMLIPALAVALSARIFHRFDPSRERVSRAKESRVNEKAGVPDESGSSTRPPAGVDHLSVAAASLSPRSTLVRHLQMELVTTLKGWPWWWYAGAVVWVIGGLVSPVGDARQYWLPVAWIWPLVLWSGMSTRDQTHQTEALMFSSREPVRLQVTMILLAGVIVSVVTGSGVLMNLIMHGDWRGLSGWCAGAVFIPVIATAAGLVTRSAKPFEVVYLLLWYLGALHPRDLPGLDYLGATNASIAAGMPAVVLLIAIGSCGVAYGARWMRLRS